MGGDEIRSIVARATRDYVAGDSGQAAALCRRALALDAGSAEAWHLLGAVLVGRGEFAHAVAAYESAIRCGGKAAENFGNLGNALQQVGRYGDAVSAYERALDLATNPGERAFLLGRLGGLRA